MLEPSCLSLVWGEGLKRLRVTCEQQGRRRVPAAKVPIGKAITSRLVDVAIRSGWREMLGVPIFIL